MTYEDQFGPVERNIRRIVRRLRWLVKGILGIRREIVVEIRWRLGDEIMALPIYSALKQAHPKSVLSVLCTYPELITARHGVDVCNPDRVDPDRYVLLRSAARDVNRIEHYARLAGVRVPADRPSIEEPKQSREDWITPAGRRVVLAPGATWPTKRWTADGWKALSQLLGAGGMELVVLGAQGESIGVDRDLTGKTSIEDCARILASADVCVCCDSGLMHLALAVGTPVVALFGPTDPWILIRDDDRVHVITNERECRFCWNGSQEMLEPGICPRKIPQCLGTIDADAVSERVQEVLARRP